MDVAVEGDPPAGALHVEGGDWGVVAHLVVKWARGSRLFIFNTHPLYTLGQSTMTVVAVYKATAKKNRIYQWKIWLRHP